HNLIYRAIAYRTSSTIVTCFVLDSAPRMGIQTLRQSRCGVDKDIPGIGDVYFIILLPAFCSNEDDAIRCSGSINRRSSCILQYRNGLNVLRIQIVHASWKAVNDHERGAPVQRTHTPHRNIHASARLKTTLIPDIEV